MKIAGKFETIHSLAFKTLDATLTWDKIATTYFLGESFDQLTKSPAIQKRHLRVSEVEPTIENTSVECMGAFAFQSRWSHSPMYKIITNAIFEGKEATGSGFKGMFLPKFFQKSSYGVIDKGVMFIPFMSLQLRSQGRESV